MNALSPSCTGSVAQGRPHTVRPGAEHGPSCLGAVLAGDGVDGAKALGEACHDSGMRSMAQPQIDDRELGRGRSGVVFLSRDETGRAIVRKVFGSSGLTKAVQYVFLGSPNPYVWNEPAIRTAVLRRRIAAELVAFWFGTKLRVARAYDYAWNAKYRAFEMQCELADARHVALHHSFTFPHHTELQDATRRIMKPLQSHLAEAGFDGLVWQAGRGNPVALNNFMCEGSDGHGGYRWVWIDLESGVPALIPMNPLDLLKFYLPKSLRHRHPLFDDVDVDKLRGYVTRRRKELEERLGSKRLCQIDEDIVALARNQQAWKSLARHKRSVGYQRARGSISREQAAWFAQHPLCWYGRESLRAVRSVPRILAACVSKVACVVARIRVGPVLKACWAGLSSQTYRERLAREYVAARIKRWTARGQLSDRHAAALYDQLGEEESSSYLTDFGVHLAVKPLVKLAQFWLMPALWMMGVIDDVFLGAFLVTGGCAVRTLYTLGRLAQNSLTGREKPWVALSVGAVPVVGNMAFPAQVVFSGTHDQRFVARFILYDTFSRLGQWLPIWGGADTLTEHLLNRLPNLILRPDASIPVQPAEDIDLQSGVERLGPARPKPISV